MDTSLLLITGSDYPIPECQLILHQPTIKEIGYIGEEAFFTGIQTLIIDKSMFDVGENDLLDINNFQLFLMVIESSEMIEKKTAVKQVLKILFPTKNIAFTKQSILFIEPDMETIIVDENNFEILQHILEQIFCLSNTINDQSKFNPVNKEASAIANKLMEGRKKIAEEKGANSQNLFGTYLSVLSIGLKLPITSLVEYTVYQIYDALERYGLYLDWDIDIRVRLAGGEGQQQPENWMKNIH